MFVILEHVVTFESLINLLGFASTSILGYENNKRKRMAESKRNKKNNVPIFQSFDESWSPTSIDVVAVHKHFITIQKI